MTDEARVFQFELRDYLQVLRRRKWTLLLAFLVVLGTGLGLSVRQEKVYQSSGQLLLDLPQENSFRAPDLATEIRLLESKAVQALARAEVPNIGQVVGRQVGLSQIIEIVVTSPDPQVAFDSVNAYFTAFTEFRREQALKKLLTEGEKIQSKVVGLRKDVETLNGELDQGREEIDRRFGTNILDASRQALALRERQTLEERVKPRRDAALSQQILLEGRLRDLQSDTGVSAGNVISPPVLPSSPVRPNPVTDGIVAGGAGLLLGVLLALLFEYLDDSITTREDLERAIGSNVPVAALIPAAPEARDPDRPEVISLTMPRSPVAEAYRSLRTSVQFLGLERPLSALSITSAVSGDGKTTTLANLAVVMAGAGRHVILLDCDLRRPRIHTFFGLPNDIGFTSVMIGDAPLSSALRKVPGVNRLSLLPSGPIPPNPSELLSSRRFNELLRTLRADGALLLIDTPPLLPVTDAAVIAASMDRVLLVSSTGMSTRKQVRQAVDILRQVDAPLTGVVLNRVAGERKGYHSHYSESATHSTDYTEARRRRAAERSTDGASRATGV